MRTRSISRRPPTLFAVAAVAAALTGRSSAGDVDHLYGQVFTAYRVPLRDAVVVVHTASGTSLRAQTDRNGRYSAVGSFDGAITIDVSHAGYVDEERACSIPPGDSARADFSIAKIAGAGGAPAPTGRLSKVPAAERTCAIDPPTVDRYNLR
jgi:hypothetical protein